MQREGVFREMKRRRFYEKPSEKTTREKAEVLRRVGKLARKQAQRDGLIAAPPKKEPRPGTAVGQPSALSLTTYFVTTMFFPAMLASAAWGCDKSESSNPIKFGVFADSCG